jgi:NACHT domain
MPEPTSVGSAVAVKVFGDLLSHFAKDILAGAGRQIYSVLTTKSTTFEAHIKATFERCTKIKTLLNRDQPVELLDLYVNLKFTSAGSQLDDYDVISQVPKLKRIVISGTGGGGKTMFMKYLWIALFENPKGKIPVFVELRRLNEVTTDQLDLYIYHSIVESQAVLPKSEFDAGVRNGQFVFILDGFDEILSEKRASLQSQILSLAHNNPNSTIILSSRKDDRFAGWQAFSVFHVVPFDKKQVIELIQKLRYDKPIAKKFVERVKKDLYAKHESFLSNPLLATMMLLTFDQFADIPEKIYLFYEQAFDTLFAKHDATKEAYKRQTYTNLSIDVFKRNLSYFCLATYNDEKFEMNETDVLAYLRKCLKIEDGSTKPEDFLRDLVESVCTLQKDGLSFVFTHRSFQEFFAAYCLANIANKHFDDILIKMARRPTDNVIKMLYDMKRELVESDFLLPRLRALKEEIDSMPRDKQFLVSYLRFLNGRLSMVVQKKATRPLQLSEYNQSDPAYFIVLLRTLYPQYFISEQPAIEPFWARDAKVLRENLSDQIRGVENGRITVKADMHKGQFVLDTASGFEQSTKMPSEYGWLCETGLENFCRKEAAAVSEVLREIEVRQRHKDKAFDTLLGIKSGSQST